MSTRTYEPRPMDPEFSPPQGRQLFSDRLELVTADTWWAVGEYATQNSASAAKWLRTRQFPKYEFAYDHNSVLYARKRA